MDSSCELKKKKRAKWNRTAKNNNKIKKDYRVGEHIERSSALWEWVVEVLLLEKNSSCSPATPWLRRQWWLKGPDSERRRGMLKSDAVSDPHLCKYFSIRLYVAGWSYGGNVRRTDETKVGRAKPSSPGTTREVAWAEAKTCLPFFFSSSSQDDVRSLCHTVIFLWVKVWHRRRRNYDVHLVNLNSRKGAEQKRSKREDDVESLFSSVLCTDSVSAGNGAEKQTLNDWGRSGGAVVILGEKT